MKRLKSLSVVIILLFTSVSGFATESLFGSWNTLIINGTLIKESPWRYYFDGALRETQRSQSQDPDQNFVVGAILLRPAIGYQLNSQSVLHIGYLYHFSDAPYASKEYHENRYWQQYQHVLKTEKYGDFQNRMRLEERTVDIGLGTCFRWRQNLKWARPLSGDWSFIINEELFYNLNSVSWGPRAGFDQNRLFFGPALKLSDSSKIELGYMNNYVHRNGKVDLVNNLLALNWFYNVPSH